MAIVNGYVTLEEFKRYVTINDASLDDLLLETCVESASRAVDGYCGRYFYADSSATARTFLADNRSSASIDDVWDTATAVVKMDSGQDGTFETTLTVSTQYIFEPVNGVQAGIAGWPASRVRLVGGQAFTSATYGRPQLQVTAKWGWAAVPSPVRSATMQVGAVLWKFPGAPYGILEGVEFGPIRIPADVMRSVVSLLAPYGAGSAQVGALA